MSEKHDGGPAYPAMQLDEEGAVLDNFPGMSLRDLFAAYVDVPFDVARDLAYREIVDDMKSAGEAPPFDEPTFTEVAAVRARLRYIEADVMLAERSR